MNLCRQIAAWKYKIYMQMQMIATRGLLTTDMLRLSSSDWQTAHMENITVIIKQCQS